MMKLTRIAVAVLLAAGVAAMPAVAQQAQPDMTTATISKAGGELEDMDVVNGEGNTIGDIDRVVRDKADNALYVVIEVGGFLGIGEKKVVVPLSQAQLMGGDLMVPLANTEDELKTRPEYNEAMYIEVSDNEMVQIGPSDEPMGVGLVEWDPNASPPGAGFGTLDRNRDGYLSKDETGGDENMMRDFEALDRNDDGLLDRAEFSAFEEGAGRVREGTMQPQPMEQAPGGQPMGPAGDERRDY